MVEGGGGEALSASCWPGGGAAAGGKGAPRGAGGSRCGAALGTALFFTACYWAPEKNQKNAQIMARGAEEK